MLSKGMPGLVFHHEHPSYKKANHKQTILVYPPESPPGPRPSHGHGLFLHSLMALVWLRCFFSKQRERREARVCLLKVQSHCLYWLKGRTPFFPSLHRVALCVIQNEASPRKGCSVRGGVLLIRGTFSGATQQMSSLLNRCLEISDTGNVNL